MSTVSDASECMSVDCDTSRVPSARRSRLHGDDEMLSALLTAAMICAPACLLVAPRRGADPRRGATRQCDTSPPSPRRGACPHRAALAARSPHLPPVRHHRHHRATIAAAPRHSYVRTLRRSHLARICIHASDRAPCKSNRDVQNAEVQRR